jgi:hypothetical protein
MRKLVHVIFHHAHVLAGPLRWTHIPVLDVWQLSRTLRDLMHV